MSVELKQVNEWLSPMANFGVIGGLVLVAMQMNLTAEAWAMAMFHPEELDEVQIGQVWAYLNNSPLSAQQT